MLRCYLAIGLLVFIPASVGVAQDITLNVLNAARSKILDTDGNEAPTILLTKAGTEGLVRSTLKNEGDKDVRIKEIVLFQLVHNLPPETPSYGEGFQMLSQTGGTLGKPIDYGSYTDAKHYRMPQPVDAIVAYGMITLSAPAHERILMGFGSCRRFVGRFHVRPKSIEVVLDTEGLVLKPGETWELEDFMFANGPDRAALLDRLTDQLRKNHPPRLPAKVPAGWCSWYCFGPSVTSKQVLENLDVIERKFPELRYVQIDDGYQPAMGDWLDTGPAFGGGIRDVLAKIRAKGFEPAIWVALYAVNPNRDLNEEVLMRQAFMAIVSVA